MTEELIQGTDKWKKARCGSLGASRISDAVAKIKSGYGASRDNIMTELLIERLTGTPMEGFTSDAMRWGSEKEPEARDSYAWRYDCEVTQIGLIRHPRILGTHASPDGLIGQDGILELKCPQSNTHIETLLSGKVPAKYTIQMQWQMACIEGRDWCDFCSYDPRLPDSMRLFVKRVNRDATMIAELEKQVSAFLEELDTKLAALRLAYDLTT